MQGLPWKDVTHKGNWKIIINKQLKISHYHRALWETEWIAEEDQNGTVILLDLHKIGNSYWNISNFFPTYFWSVYTEVLKKESNIVGADVLGKVLSPTLQFTNFSRLFFRRKLLLNTSLIRLCFFSQKINQSLQWR